MASTKFDGFSKKTYDYQMADLKALNTLPTLGGNYVFASRVGGKPTIVFAAETENIRAAVASHPRWAEARNRHEAIFIFTHMSSNPALRRLEVHDLVRLHAPPMNAAAQVADEDD